MLDDARRSLCAACPDPEAELVPSPVCIYCPQSPRSFSRVRKLSSMHKILARVRHDNPICRMRGGSGSVSRVVPRVPAGLAGSGLGRKMWSRPFPEDPIVIIPQSPDSCAAQPAANTLDLLGPIHLRLKFL